MLLWLLAALALRPTPGPIDVSTLKLGAPVVVAALDLGKLKGELRQMSWAPDGSQLYIQTVEGPPTAEERRHYVVARDGGAIKTLDAEPAWAAAYWSTKSDRAAPGLGSVMIDVEQKLETMKFGTGSAGAADRASNGLGADNINIASNVEKAAEGQRVVVVRLRLYDETISEFVNERPLPGLMFSWGAPKSGAIAFTDRDGRLTLLDGQKRKQSVKAAKDAVLPAWSLDGSQLAWAQKTGRRKYTVMYVRVDGP